MKVANISWTDNSSNEDGFIVSRWKDGGAPVVVATTVPGITSATDDEGGVGLTPGATYVWGVKSFNAEGESVYVMSAPITVPTAPAAPGGITIVLVTS